MSRTLNNFQSIFDDCHKINDNFNNHVASPGIQYNSCSLSKRLQQQQSPKMPGLLRLDSVGEVSSVRLPADRNTKPVLRNCKSNDCDTVSVSKRSIFSTQSNMVTVKSLAGKLQYNRKKMSEPVDTKAHLFSSTLNQNSSRWLYGMNSPMNYYHNSLHSENMFPKQKPRIHDLNKVCASPSHCKCAVIKTGAFWTAVDSCICSEDGKGIVSTGSCSPLSILCKLAATCKTYEPFPDFSVPTSSMQFQEKSIPCSNSSCNLSAKEVNLNNSIDVGETIQNFKSQLNPFEVNVVFGKNPCEERQQPVDEFSSSECQPHLLLDIYNNNEMDSTTDDALKSGSIDRKSSSDGASQCFLKPGIDLSSVLSAPRRTIRKGRPSSKKQKKRQREKHKQDNLPSGKKELVDVTDKTLELVNQANSRCSQQDRSKKSCSPIKNFFKTESSVKVQSKCPVMSLFVGRTPGFEEIDDKNSSDDDSDNFEESEWSLSNDKMTCIPLVQCPGLNIALNLDSIFKSKSIPSLKSIFSAEESDSDSETTIVPTSTNEFYCQSLTVNTSKDDSFEDSVEFCVPLTSSELKSFGFNTGLSEDLLFNKKPNFCSTKLTAEPTVDVVDGLLSNGKSHHASSNLESCLEAMSQINAKWDLDYPSAGFRSCKSGSAGEIQDSSIKVHFAAEPNLFTVHIVGTEERCGLWYQCALDRERFTKRILDLAEIVSPILEASHRAKILDRNRCCRLTVT